MDVLFDHWKIVVGVAAVVLLLLCYKLVLWLFGVIIVRDDSIGVVTKKFVLFGKHRNLPDGRIVALDGEAGFQADTLAPGLHAGYWPWQYRVNKVPVTVVPQGEIALVIAADGAPIPSERILGRVVDCDNFQDARKFLRPT